MIWYAMMWYYVIWQFWFPYWFPYWFPCSFPYWIPWFPYCIKCIFAMNHHDMQWHHVANDVAAERIEINRSIIIIVILFIKIIFSYSCFWAQDFPTLFFWWLGTLDSLGKGCFDKPWKRLLWKKCLSMSLATNKGGRRHYSKPIVDSHMLSTKLADHRSAVWFWCVWDFKFQLWCGHKRFAPYVATA